MYKKRDPFIDKINIFFKDTKVETINVSSIDRKNIILESDRQIKKIEDIIKIKKLEKNKSNTIENKLHIINGLGLYIPLENRSIQELNKRLKTAKDTYGEDDLYEYQEKYAYRLNFDIFNSSIKYIEDASVIITIAISDNYYIFDKPIEEPSNSLIPTVNHLYQLKCIDYPNVDNINNHFVIKTNIGDIKHQIKTEMFKYDLFIFLRSMGVSYNIPIHIKLFGKNLIYLIEKELIIHVK